MENLVISGEIVVEALRAAVAKHIKIEKGITITKDDVLDMIKEAILDNVDIQKAAKAFPIDGTDELTAFEDTDEEDITNAENDTENDTENDEELDTETDEEFDIRTEDDTDPADEEPEVDEYPEPVKPAPRKKVSANSAAKVAGKASKNVSGGMAVDVEAEEEAKNANDVRNAAKKLSKEISLKGIAVRQKLKKIVGKYSEDGSIGGIPDSLIGKYYAHIKKFADNLE